MKWLKQVAYKELEDMQEASENLAGSSVDSTGFSLQYFPVTNYTCDLLQCGRQKVHPVIFKIDLLGSLKIQ